LDFYLDGVRNAQKLIYGELRYKDTLEEVTRLAAQARPGLASQHPNVRDVMRHAIELLNNGGAAYPTLVSMVPVVEAVTKQLAAKHFTELRVHDTSDILYELLKTAQRRQDKGLELLSSAGLAANKLRNLVAHEPNRSFDEHHAQFLFHALSLMLREL
jgi:hypothetical protein